MGVLYMHSHLLVTRVRLPPTPTLTLALAPADRSGQPVKTDAAKYVTHHDAEGIHVLLFPLLDCLDLGFA